MKSTKEQAVTLSKEKAIWMYQKMVEIRKFEDKLHEIFATGAIPGFVHLYAGRKQSPLEFVLI
ncbi:Acetoin:2,6-dichlorophenolindophenol oxidoreductase subunit alpha [Halalkalibacter krulwichiae]|uniref:Acetoin:2,6-dichlorophenolindophenol oxidoreductase subunit alpha n=1 Tax=Halalkalibacter krulwichiae TaxID=199441 RepID=A0A1X9MC39_9BACI|nr:Acetoin:2,6-dichlorophenolindophenol oxidoreductase subunit alpha [Halalkalibacter krulwichiae]